MSESLFLKTCWLPHFYLKKTPTKVFPCEVCEIFKAGLLPSKNKFFFICFNESPLKMMKNAFYFILKAPFVFKIFKILS